MNGILPFILNLTIKIVSGTKIVYEKSYLLHLRNSPISKTPPKYDIPQHLQMGSPNKSMNHHDKRSFHRKPEASPKNYTKKTDEDDQFQMDL